MNCGTHPQPYPAFQPSFFLQALTNLSCCKLVTYQSHRSCSVFPTFSDNSSKLAQHVILHFFFNMYNPAAQVRLTRACTNCRERKVKCMHPQASSREASFNGLKAVEAYSARIAPSREAPVHTQPRVGAGQETSKVVEALKTRFHQIVNYLRNSLLRRES